MDRSDYEPCSPYTFSRAFTLRRGCYLLDIAGYHTRAVSIEYSRLHYIAPAMAVIRRIRSRRANDANTCYIRRCHFYLRGHCRRHATAISRCAKTACPGRYRAIEEYRDTRFDVDATIARYVTRHSCRFSTETSAKRCAPGPFSSR